jgi:hypothetical protein
MNYLAQHICVDAQAILAAARAELDYEKYRAAVGAAKKHLRARRWWHRLFPYTIIIQRRTYD